MTRADAPGPFASRRASRDIGLASAVPYTAMLSPYVLHTRAHQFVFGFRLAGSSFETADDRQLNDWHERLNLLWRTIADPSVAVWCHVIRHSVAPTLHAGGMDGFAAGLAKSTSDE